MIQLIHASLPVKARGFVMLLCLHLPPFMASAASIRNLQSHLLLNYYIATDPHFDWAIIPWPSFQQIPLPVIKQHALDAPVIAAEKALIWASLTNSHNNTRLLAASSPYSGDWLQPARPRGLMWNKTRFAIGLRLGMCVKLCPCSTLVDSRGTHGLSCKRSVDRLICRHQLNDLIWRALARARLVVHIDKEPAGRFRSDGMCPYGFRQIL